MANLMSTIYIGYVVEIIYKNSKPTLDLRIRVPSIHGASADRGIADKDLPIARPLMMPGIQLSSINFTKFIQSTNKLYIVFESGNFNKPVYLGVKGNTDLYDIPMDEINDDWLDSFDIVNPQKDEILVYNDITKKWTNQQQIVSQGERSYAGSDIPDPAVFKTWLKTTDSVLEPENQPMMMSFGMTEEEPSITPGIYSEPVLVEQAPAIYKEITVIEQIPAVYKEQVVLEEQPPIYKEPIIIQTVPPLYKP